MNLTFENVSDDHAVLMMEWYTALTNNMLGKITDGYHTFDELYHHRAVLFSVICNTYKESAWKSKKHHDGTMYDGMFIVGINTPEGQATYHYDLEPYWDMFNVKELDKAPQWDGHSPTEAIERIGKLKTICGMFKCERINERPICGGAQYGRNRETDNRAG